MEIIDVQIAAIKKQIEIGLPTHEEILMIFPDTNIVDIFDQRDISEIKRRKKKQTCYPIKNELYSVNPDFNGIYSDPQNR